MQIDWIVKNGNDKLLVVVLGWAADPTMVAGVVELRKDFDIVCIYDFREIRSLDTLGNYPEIHLIAWSYGVWAAEQILPEMDFASAVAVNGTPLPVDDEFGIQKKIFELTVNNINISKFEQRMCFGMRETVKIRRPENECIDELRALQKYFQNPYKVSIKWSKAVVGGRDLIFPPEKQLKYWNSNNTEVDYRQNAPHFIGI